MEPLRFFGRICYQKKQNAKGGSEAMDIKELRKMTLAKLRESAKQGTDLAMKKEDLIKAIAKAEGISYEGPLKDLTTISSIKQEIRALNKQKEEILASSRDPSKIGPIRKKIKKLKRLTRRLARTKVGVKGTPQPSPTA
jgi:hypothetical protein